MPCSGAGRMGATRRAGPRARQRGIWLQNIGFLGVALFSTVILTRPWATGWALLGFLVGALGLALLFERRVFCRHVCPVGGFIGLYSMFFPLELRVRDPAVCREHRTKDCYLGNAAGYGCPWMEQPWKLDRNAYCGLCGECLRTCPRDNVRVSLRRPGTDLLVALGYSLVPLGLAA
jgi:polyferredoxin